MTGLQTKEQTKLAAEGNFETFVRLIAPHRVIPLFQSELMSWMTREEKNSHLLVLLPRDHGKSSIAGGYYAAWEITRNPAIRILYISSASNLATKQLKFIKDILTSKIYRFYWPEMVNEEETKREKWSETEISVDHPKRKAEFIRDPTVFTAGLTTSIVGLHCDLSLMDDVVTAQNAWTEEGRRKVEQQYSLLASIEGANARSVVIGTRYHPKDLYGTLLSKVVEIFDEEGTKLDSKPLYEVHLKQVETVGDGTGEFLWPRQQRYDGEWFGFNREILAKKKALYIDQIQFRAQYYNNPNDSESATIKKDYFQYYDRSFLSHNSNTWYYKNNKLNVFAAMDFAYSLSNKADYSSIVVVGVDSFNNYYVLDIDRFKTDLISEYFNHLLKLHQKWGFRKLKAEVSVAQKVIVNDLKQNHIRPNGLALSVEDYRPSKLDGSKEERMEAILQPRYANRQMWHYQGGHCQTLEEELVLTKPPHDDIKDALATCVDFCIAPSPSSYRQPTYSHARFGGSL